MKVEYSLFLIREGAVDDVGTAARFSNIHLNSLINENANNDTSFGEKIKKTIKFILEKISNFFKNLFSRSDKVKDANDAISKSKVKEVTVNLFSKVHDCSFDLVSPAKKILDEVRSGIDNLDMSEDVFDQAKRVTSKYINDQEFLHSFLGVRKEFTVTKEKSKQIISHAEEEINGFNKIHEKLKEMYFNIGNSLSDSESENKHAKIQHKLKYLNHISGIIFTHLKMMMGMIQSSINGLKSKFVGLNVD